MRPDGITAADLPIVERVRRNVLKVPNRQVELRICRSFLNQETCSLLIQMIDGGRRPSTIADDIGVARFRTSETCDLDEASPVVARVGSEISELLGLPAAHGEPMQGQRYATGQEFKAHTDYFETGGADYDVYTARGGQRTWTAMVYLNEPDAGGATRFKNIDKLIRPETGKLVFWNNLLPNGQPNYATLHHGMRVRAGVKYVITKWFRQRPWR